MVKQKISGDLCAGQGTFDLIVKTLQHYGSLPTRRFSGGLLEEPPTEGLP
jgi:hypothetical protein